MGEFAASIERSPKCFSFRGGALPLCLPTRGSAPRPSL